MAATSAALRQAANKRRTKDQLRDEVNMLESALLSLFEKEQPSIYKVREILTRLASLVKRPNQAIAGDWIVFWASREGCVDKTFGTGVTEDDMWLQMQEFLLRFSSRKEGRTVQAAEVIRKVGPFPNLSNSMSGKYEIMGTNGLRMTFDEIQTDESKDVEVKGAKITEKVVDVDVIYSSPQLIAMQTEDESGECDFYVLTPVRDIKREVNKLLGLERRRFFFS